MLAFVIRQLFRMAMVLLAMSFVVFCLQTIVPADPVRAIAGPMTPLSRVSELREELGLNDPVFVQYGRFIVRIVEGDLGTSLRTRKPILADISKYYPASLELSLAALIAGNILALLFAMSKLVVRPAQMFAYGMTAAGSVPVFMSALLLAYVFWFHLGWLPGSQRMSLPSFNGPTGLNTIDSMLAGNVVALADAVRHLVLPTIALAFPIAVAVGRVLGSSLREVMQQQYIATARGKGLSEGTVIVRHAMRNAAPAALAMVALQVRLLFGNLLVVELVFQWPGLGLYMVQSLASGDLPAILGVTIVISLAYLVVSLVIDIAQMLLNPRIRE